MERLNFEDERLWKGLLVLGILLNVLVCFVLVDVAIFDAGFSDLLPTLFVFLLV